MKLPNNSTTLALVVIVLLLGALYTMAAVVLCESPRWEMSPLGFVRLHCADSATWTGFLFSRTRWRLSFNLYLCIAWPVLILGTILVRGLQGRLDD